VRKSYNEVIAVFKAASEAMGPVLSHCDDYLLFLSHGVSARAVGTLEDTQDDFLDLHENLEKRTESAVKEADDFLKLAEAEFRSSSEPAK
jgi:hypothetical protein